MTTPMTTPMQLNNPIIKSAPYSLNIRDILESYDGPSFEKATTTYRKPSYQRAFQQSTAWCRLLCESILMGWNIGCIIISEWAEFYQLGDEIGHANFYNIEDGQTRIDAFVRFKNGEFSTKFGDYESVKERFNSYKLIVCLQKKAHSRIPNKIYHRQLLENFSLLQDGVKLSDSDRYFVWVADEQNGISGSPLVNNTLRFINSSECFRTQFAEFANLNVIDSRSGDKARKPLAEAIALISACWKGPSYANKSYTRHIDILNENFTQDDIERVTKFLTLVFAAIKLNFQKFPKYKNESCKKVFLGTRTYLGTMITDLYDNPDQNTGDFINRWGTLMSIHRHLKHRDTVDVGNRWLESTVYTNLCSDDLTRCGANEFRLKRDAISTWWINFAEQAYNYTLDNDVSDGQSDDDESDQAETTY
jgi:hypothetical protein